MTDFDPLRILRTLAAQRVTFLIIGGIAGRVLGSASATNDLDICYERSRPNLERLAAALRALHARLRGPGGDPDLPVVLDAKALEFGAHFTFSTDVGDFDCLGTPKGTDGYPDLARNAVAVPLGDLTVRVAGLDDLIRMKRAAGRPKDRIELEILGALREEIDRRAR